MSELTPEQKVADLNSGWSNQGTVDAISTAGHVGTGAVLADSAITAYSTGGMAALKFFAGRVLVPIGAAMAGAALADLVGADKALMKLAGAQPLAPRGPQPATRWHKIAHNNRFKGFLTGLAVGLAVGVLVAATIASGGALGPVAVLAIAGLVGGFAGSAVGGAVGSSATVCGFIDEGSPNVNFENKPVARVYDMVKCDRHSPPTRIAEGSMTIFVNGMALARIGHKISCSAVIQEGCKTINADNTTRQYGKIDSDMSIPQQLLVSALEVFGARAASRSGGLMPKWLRNMLGDPVDAATGDVAAYHTDFEYPGILPLQLTRAYSGKERIDGLLGAKWICNWSQRILYDKDEPTAILEDSEGQRLEFALGQGQEFNSRHLKAPCYHLTGTRKQARLFDTSTQQFLVFTTDEHDPHTGFLSAIEDRNGNRIDFIYNGEHLHRINHSDGTLFLVKTTQQGFIESLTIKGESQPLVRYEYDATGAMTDVYSRFGGELHYTYTKEGWLNHWRDSGATRVDFEYDSEGRVIATRTPDGIYNDRFIYHPEERKTEYIDATGACRTIWFNKDNLLIRERDPLGNVTEHFWDGLERKQSTTDPLGRVTRFEYDQFGLLTGETDWAGRSARFKYNREGQLTQVDHPHGGKTSWEYDGRGNLISSVKPDGQTFHYTYDEQGNLLTETGPDASRLQWEYTSQGRLYAFRDALGHRTAIDRDIWGRPRSITNADGHTTRYRFDISPDNPRGDITSIVHPDGGEESFSYDKEGLITSRTGAEGQVTRYRHGAFDLLRTVIDPKGCITSLDYDGAARLTGITNAGGRKWRYGYDGAGRIISETDWAGRQTTYTRDAIGRVLSKRLPDGVEQHLTWDERDRIVSVSTNNNRISYQYDGSDRLIRAATYSGDTVLPDSDLLFFYDDKGRIFKEVQNGLSIDYQYDTAGRCINRKSPSGETSVEYDLLGLPSDYFSNGHVLSFERNALGLEIGRESRRTDAPTVRNAFTLIQSYDPCGRLSTQSAGQGGSTSPSPARISRHYHWDRSGRLLGVKDSVRGQSRYSYDPRDQVLKVGRKGRTTEQYSYDALMNLASSNEGRHEYRKDCVFRVGNTSYRYDARGRVVARTIAGHGFRPKTWRYLWDDFDRLIETCSPEAGTWRYTYDAFGRRSKKECVKPGKSGGTKQVTYLWQGAALAEEWTDAANNGKDTQVSRWHFEPGTFRPIAKETLTLGTGAEKAGEPRFYPMVTDHLGTPKEMFDTDGECLWQADHTLWGKTSVVWRKMRKQTDGAGKETQADSPWPEVECNLRFQNQWEDEESGLYYNLHRYYDPESGQYLSPDPIGLAGGLRSHGYVHDPVGWVDPLGLCKRQTTILGENQLNRVIPFARKTGARTLPFGVSRTEWDAMTAKQRYKINDGSLRARINEGDNFRYIGQDADRLPSVRRQFDLTRSELLRLNDRNIPYETVSKDEIITILGRD